jgi:hypothetical protein
MTVAEIIAALTPYTGHFPTEAVEAAMAQPEEVTPHLLRHLEEVVEAPDKFARNDFMLHLFASYLLAQFREKRAYPLLTRIVAAPGETADKLFGETITEGLEKILASVYDGNPEPLKRLVEGEEVDEFVRGAAVDTFLVLTRTGQLPRAAVVEYFQELFRGKLVREYNQVWNELTCAVADLPAPELVGDLRKAYEEGLMDEAYAELEELAQEALVPFEQKEDWKRKKLTSLVTDTVSEMSWWAAFQENDGPDEFVEREELDTQETAKRWIEPDAAGLPAVATSPGPGFRREPKIGRNDPCPCGSGKKYKKCCLGK